ncbi:MAG: NgoBV family restriction endonuclease [Bacteroidales bacterium]|jgi:type II restriction enzyme|nr:NgoBV family restriction endonuclease [Bacteroidales bacterium]
MAKTKDITIEEIFDALCNDFKIVNATGCIQFNLNKYKITVKQNSVVGNILEEWLANWFKKQGYAHIHNTKQTPPDFWLNPNDLTKEMLEVKCFYKGPGFDIANFISYAKEIIEKPYRLYSKYLLLKYDMNEATGIVTIENVWLKNVWEICSSSGPRPIKVQEKSNVIYNIRPATWYTDHNEYPVFECLEDFLAAIEQTLYDYNQTRSTLAESWAKKLCKAYKECYGKELILPRWYDIKDKYHNVK